MVSTHHVFFIFTLDLGRMFTEEEKNELLIRIGKAVAHLREKKRLTLVALGDEIDADGSWIAKVEKGKHDIQVSTLGKFADFFKVDICFFLTYEEEKKSE